MRSKEKNLRSVVAAILLDFAESLATGIIHSFIHPGCHVLVEYPIDERAGVQGGTISLNESSVEVVTWWWSTLFGCEQVFPSSVSAFIHSLCHVDVPSNAVASRKLYGYFFSPSCCFCVGLLEIESLVAFPSFW